MISEASDAFPANKSMTPVYIPDGSAIFDRALHNGATAVQEPAIADGDTDERVCFPIFMETSGQLQRTIKTIVAISVR